MAIDLGKFDKQKNYGRGISLGVFDKIPEDLDFDAFKREYLEREKRSIGESVWEWADAFPTGVDQMIDSAKESMTNKSVVKGMFNFADFEEMKDAWKTVGLTAKIGLADEWHTYRAVKNNIQNELSSSSQDDKIRKAYELRKFRENYFNVDRENMLSEVPKEFRADADFGADFLTPTNLLPAFFGKKVVDKPVRASIKGGVKGVGLVAKGAEKLSEGVEKALGYPSKKLDEVLPKGGVAYRGVQMVGLASDTGIGTFFGSMVFVEGLAKIAKKTSREISEVSRVFAQPSSHARFLYRLSTDEAVSASTRKLAARMYKLRGTRAYDVLFDGLVAGLSSSAMQSAMEFAQGSSAEEMGQASGAGFVLGTPVGMASGSRNSGKADEDRSDLSINNYLEKKANQQNQDTVKALKQLDRDTLISLSTMDEFAELGDYNMQLMDHKNFKEKILGEDESVDSENLPAASYNQETKVIILDESKLKEGTEKARKIVMHEIGHAYLREMLGSNPLMRRKILEKFEDENGREYFFTDLDGVKNGSIKVNKQAENFMREYAMLMGVKPENFAKSKYADNAFLLAEEIGAEQFSALMRETPNVFKRYEKSFRHSLLNAGKDVLGKLGIIDADSGNLIDSPISASLLKNKDVQNLFTNYMQARNDHYRMRADDIEKGRKHEPRKGQDSADRFTELFGGHGINIGLGSHFAVKDRQMFDELVKAAELDAQGADSDLTGIGKNFEGKRLGAQTKDIFRKAGANGGGAMNIIDFFQNVIDTRSMIKFGYRSAKWWDRSHYNPFYERSFTAIGWQISPKKPTTRMGRTVYPNLKIVGYDADLIMSNAELLAQAGFLKGKYKDTAEFLDAFSKHAESLLQQTGEKRINPLGQGENELFVAALGRIAGEKFIPKIQDPELSDFFTDPNSKLKQAYRSYDVGAMAGVTSLNKKGLAFNYSNAKHNYMPSLSGAGSEGSTIPRTLYMPRDVYAGTLDQRGLEHNLFRKVLPNIKQEKFTPEQLISEVNKNKGAQEFLDDIGITKDVLEEIKVKKTISKDLLEYLINSNQKAIDLRVDSSRKSEQRTDHLYEGYLERGDYTNYEELTFALPESLLYETGDVTGGHWQNDRVLFHIRKSDRPLPNGEESFHVEEVQSDWHAHARANKAKGAQDYIKDKDRKSSLALQKELVDKISKIRFEITQKNDEELRQYLLEDDKYKNLIERWFKSEYSDYYLESPVQANLEVDKHIKRLNKDVNENDLLASALDETGHKSRVHNEARARLTEVSNFFKRRVEHEEKVVRAKEVKESGEYDNVYKKIRKTFRGDSIFAMHSDAEIDKLVDKAMADARADQMLVSVYDNLSEAEANARRAEDKQTYGETRRLITDVDAFDGSRVREIKKDRKIQELDAELGELRKVSISEQNIQSDAPMKNSWHSRALAEAINKAIKEGKKYLTWVTGERSAQQNNLDHHFVYVNVEQKFGGYGVKAESKAGRTIRRNVDTAEELADLIGKDATKYAVKELKGTATGTQVSVHDVKTKNEGRRTFYDKIMVGNAKRFAKIMGTRPPIKSKIDLQRPVDKSKLTKLDLPSTETPTPTPQQEVWLMELPDSQPTLPLYMPSIRDDMEALPKIIQRDFNNFKAWFRNSMIVNEDGTPKRVYHGTKKIFDIFKATRFADGLLFFHEDPEFTEQWIKGSSGHRAPTEKTREKYEKLDQDWRDKWNKKFKEYEERTGKEAWKSEVMDQAKADEAKIFAPFRNMHDALDKVEGNIIPVYLSVQNLFDPRKHLDIALDFYRTEKYRRENVTGENGGRTGGWDMNDPSSVKTLQEYGSKGAYLIFENEGMVNWLSSKGFDGMRLSESQSMPDYKTIAVWDNTKIKSAIANKGTFDSNNPSILHMPNLPQKPKDVVRTKKAYKLFRVGKNKQLYPLFVNADEPVKINEWQVAEMGASNPNTGKVKSRIGDLAYRAGWHASDLPVAMHIGAKSKKGLNKPDTRRPNEVWAEVEIADDFDWTAVAKERAERNKDGSIKAYTAQIVDQVPYNGHYRYKTNPNMFGEWLISGQMKVNKVLSDKEVQDINRNSGLQDLQRREPMIDVKLREADITESENVTHGYVPPVIKTADDSMPLYIPDFLVGEPIMPIVGDRLMATPFTARSGNIFQCRGGHDHPLVEDHKGQVAWACGQSGSEPDNVALSLLKAIEQSPNGYAATLLMGHQAHVSNRTFARITLDEMMFDAMNVKNGQEIVFKHAEEAIARWNAEMKKNGKDKLLDRTNLKTFQDLPKHIYTIPFEQRKPLVMYLLSDAYKTKIKKAGGFDPINWRDLVKRTGQYMPEDGYQIGDMIHIIKFDTSNPVIDLKEIGATPDPTYDISFRGEHVHTFEGKVSAYDLFKGSLDYFAYDPVWTAENKKVPDAVRTVEKGKIGSDAFQMFRYHGTKPQMQTPVTQENTIPASKPLNYTTKTKKENMYLDNRRKENTKIRKRKLAELKG